MSPSESRSELVDARALLEAQAWVRGLARGLAGDESLAEDAAQEAWILAQRRGPRSPGAVRSYVASVARNAWRSLSRAEARRGRRERAAARAEALPSAGALAERAELHRVLVEGVLALGEAERTALLLHYFEGLPAAEIARRAGVPDATVRARLARGVAKLRAELEQRLGLGPERLRGLLLSIANGSSLGAPGAPGASSSSSTSPAPPPAAAAAGAATGAGASLPLLSTALAMKLVLPLVSCLVVIGAAGWWLAASRASEGPRGEASAAAARPAARAEPALGSTAPALASEPTRAPVAAYEPAPAPEPAASAGSAPSAPRVEGRVVDELGRPVAGATLSTHDEPRGRSDGAGGFACALPAVPEPSATTLTVAAAGFASARLVVRVAPGGTTQLGDVRLVPAGELHGRVVDPSGRPVAGVRVLADGLENERTDPEELRRQGPRVDEGTVPETTSDAHGRFVLAGVPAGPARAWAGGGEHAWGSAGPLEVVPRGVVHDVVIEIEPLRADDLIQGVVLDPDGVPVADAMVQYWYVGARYGTGGGVRAGKDGRFVLKVAERVVHDLTVLDPEDRWGEILAPGVTPGTRDLELVFEPARWLDVTVVDEDGRPVEGFALESREADVGMSTFLRTRRDSAGSGTARLRLPPIPFVVIASARGFEPDRQGPIDPDGPPTSLVFELHRLPGVHGVVLDPDGMPVAQARVALVENVSEGTRATRNGLRVRLDPNGPSDTTTTDGEGRFTVYPERAGLHELEVEATGWALSVVPDLRLDPAVPADVEIVTTHGGGIEGRVLPPPGGNAEGVVLVIHRGDGRERTLRSGRDGEYRLDGLTPGPWEVVVREHELAPEDRSTSFTSSGANEPWLWSCEVAAGRTTRYDVDLRGEGACILEGRLVTSVPLAMGWTASLEVEGDAFRTDVADSTPLAPDGSFRLEGRSGPQRLVLRGPAEACGRLELAEELELRAGSQAIDVELELGRLVGSGAVSPEGRERIYELRWERVAAGRTLTGVVRIVPAADGRFTLSGVPAGPATIRSFDPPSEGDRYAPWVTRLELEVPAGGERVVDLR